MMPSPFRLLDDITSGQTLVAARRELTVFGAPVELAWIPARRKRRNVPGGGRATFRADIGAEIVERESLWRGDGVAWTPNKFPFGERHGILWRDGELRREADSTLLRAAFAITSASGGTALGNCIGSAASIQRAHLHLVEEQLPFLQRLPTTSLSEDSFLSGVRAHRLADEIPFVAIRLDGEPPARAEAAATWIKLRLTAAFNIIDDGSTTWVIPRGAEIPAPDFPYALGAAELWGRWCYGEEAPFATATGAGLERALAQAGVGWAE